jgi:phosphate transport system substrate-binding protein
MSSNNSFALSQVTINGAGSTFVFPLVKTWRIAYQKVHPNVNINYQSIGSSGGVKQFSAKTVDFGASDAPLNAEERQAAPGAVQIPETIGSVAVAYNIPGIPTKTLKFTGPVLADIFQGKITKWNDREIRALNPGVNLPDANIAVVHRSDGSGTTYVWTSYLSKESPLWNQTIGASKTVPWPTGIGASGSEGVANTIKSSPNSIGYIELDYALTKGIPIALVKNPTGNFIECSLNSTQELVGRSGYTLIGTYELHSFGLQKIMEVGTIIGDKAYMIQYIADAPRYSDYLPTVQKMIGSLVIKKFVE